MDWLTILSLFAGAAMLAFASRSKRIAQHPSQRGIIVGMGLALLGSAAWLTFQKTAPQFDADKLFTAGLIVLSIPLYAVMIAAPFVRKRAGAVLYEAQLPQTRRYSGYVTALLFAFLALATIIQTGLTGSTIAQMAFYFSVIIYFSSPLYGKVELRQEGIIESYSLLRWGKIVSRQWIGEDECNLILSTNNAWRKTATLVFPPDEKNAIEAILTEHMQARQEPAAPQHF